MPHEKAADGCPVGAAAPILRSAVSGDLHVPSPRQIFHNHRQSQRRTSLLSSKPPLSQPTQIDTHRLVHWSSRVMRFFVGFRSSGRSPRFPMIPLTLYHQSRIQKNLQTSFCLPADLDQPKTTLPRKPSVLILIRNLYLMQRLIQMWNVYLKCAEGK